MKADRYIRQSSLPDFGPEAQEKLRNSRVLVVGIGGLGIPVLHYLNAMGVGTLGLVDQDIIELSNLQRQPLYREEDLGKPKLAIALEALKSRNSETRFEVFNTFLVRQNALDIIRNFDVVMDASDNFPTRYLINDACVMLNKPFVSGAIHGFEGQLSVYNYRGGPTYRCLFPDIPSADEIPDCDRNGVLGVIPGIIGTLQALEGVKILTDIGEPLSGKLLLFNGLDNSFRTITFNVVPGNLTVSGLPEYGSMPGCSPEDVITADEFQRRFSAGEILQVVDVRSPEEFLEYHIPRSINIPMSELTANIGKINTRLEVYCICQTGQRSRKALEYIKNNTPGSSVFHISGGIENYRMLCH